VDSSLVEEVGWTALAGAVAEAMAVAMEESEAYCSCQNTQAQTKTVNIKSIQRGHLFKREARLTAVDLVEKVDVVGAVDLTAAKAETAGTEAKGASAEAQVLAGVAMLGPWTLRWRTQTRCLRRL
jgi:hypothetical protein